MEFVIEKQALEKALAQLARISPERTTQPILSNILILAHPENWISLTATNISVDLRIVLPAQVKTSGTVTVSANHLHKWVSGTRADKIDFRLTEKRLNLVGAKDKSHLAIQPAEDFPTIYFKEDDQPIAVVQSKDLQKAIKQALVSAATEDTQVRLYAVLLDIFAGDEIVVVGGDGYRMTKKTIQAHTFGEIKLLISRPFVVELEKVLANYSGEVKIIANQRRAQFIFDNIYFATLLVDFPFINYPVFFQDVDYKSTVGISAKEMLTALNTVRVFTQEGSSPFIEFATNTTHISLTSDSLVPSEFGTGESIVDAEIEGDEWTKAYNVNMLADAIGAMDVPTVYLLNGVRTATLTQDNIERTIESSFMYLADAKENPMLIHIISPRG